MYQSDFLAGIAHAPCPCSGRMVLSFIIRHLKKFEAAAGEDAIGLCKIYRHDHAWRSPPYRETMNAS